MRRAALGGILAAVVGVGCGGEESPEPPVVSQTAMTRAKDFRQYEISWLGREFKGLPLQAIDIQRRRPDRSVTLYYSNCYGGESDDPCEGEDLSIAIDPVQEAAPPRRAHRFNGVPGVRGRGEYGTVTVHLFGDGIDVLVKGTDRTKVDQAATELRPLNDPPKGNPRGRDLRIGMRSRSGSRSAPNAPER